MSDSSVNRLELNEVHLNSLGLGIEHFARGVRKITHLTREENSKCIIEEAYKLGITHYDLVFNLPYFFDVFREFIKNKREKITFTTHLGSFFNEKANGHSRTRSLRQIKQTFESMIDNLNVNFADIALIQFVTNKEDYEKVVKNGILDYALNLREEGKARAIGVSAHNPVLLKKMIENGDFDVIMLPLNFATGILKETKELIAICKKKSIAIIAIKNLLKGKAFTTKTANYPAYFCGGNRFSMKLEKPTNPKQCMKFALDLGADNVVFGVKTVEELIHNVSSYMNEKESADYSKIVQKFKSIISN